MDLVTIADELRLVGRNGGTLLFVPRTSIVPFYRATLTCAGLTEDEGCNAPSDVLEEFARRPWHKNVSCRWDGELLWLEAENDYDSDGEALFDEFRDVVIACVLAEGTISFEIRSVVLFAET